MIMHMGVRAPLEHYKLSTARGCLTQSPAMTNSATAVATIVRMPSHSNDIFPSFQHANDVQECRLSGQLACCVALSHSLSMVWVALGTVTVKRLYSYCRVYDSTDKNDA